MLKRITMEEVTQVMDKFLQVDRMTYKHPVNDLHKAIDLLEDAPQYKVGEIVHSGSLKEFDERHRDRRVLVVGGGETASDILDEWYPNVSSIIWCIPRGQHFFRKKARILPHRKPQALDKASSRALKLIAPFVKSKPGLAWICRWTTNGSLTAYQGHGIPEFRNNATFFHSFINKHAHALDYIDYDKVIPKVSHNF